MALIVGSLRLNAESKGREMMEEGRQRVSSSAQSLLLTLE